MTSRERILAAMHYRQPDRIPLYYHPSPAGLHVHGRKLLDLFARYPADNAVTFSGIPQPPPGTVGPDGEYHEFKADDWGITWEHRIFGIQGQPSAYPFESWRAARDYAFPPVAEPGGEPFAQLERRVSYDRARTVVIDGWVSLFMQLYALRPMEEVLIDLVSEAPDLLAFLDRLTDYWERVVRAQLAAGFDAIMFADDWVGQTAQFVSTGLFRRHFLPRYHRLMAPIRRAGRAAFFHVCGCPSPIIDELLGMGIDGIWPQIALFDLDAFSRQCQAHGVLTYLHLDRQHLIPRGRPDEIERTVARYAEHFHRLGGGAMFYVEIENDAPFENVRALIEAVDRYR